MRPDSLPVRIARDTLERLRSDTPVPDVVVEVKGLLGDRRDLLDEVWEEIIGQLGSDTGEPESGFTQLLARVYRFAIGLGSALDWRRGVVDGARGLSHLFVDVIHRPDEALFELAAIEGDLFDADPSVWALIKGDMGIAMLHLKRMREAIEYLAVPCGLQGSLVPVELAARYRGNLGLALAGEGLFDQARSALVLALEGTSDPELLEKFASDLRNINELSQ